MDHDARLAGAAAGLLTRSNVVGHMSGIRVVQAHGRQEEARRRFREANADYRSANMSTITVSGLYFPGVELLAALGLSAGEDAALEASMAKTFASEAAFEAGHQAMQICGANGYAAGSRVEVLCQAWSAPR